MRKLLIIGGLFALAGCANIVDIGRGAADRTLSAAEVALCDAPTAGALRRKYTTKEAMDKWNSFCNTATVEILRE